MELNTSELFFFYYQIDKLDLNQQFDNFMWI